MNLPRLDAPRGSYPLESLLTVELLDEFDQSLPDYSGENTATAIIDGTQSTVVWSEPVPVDRTVALRVTWLDDGDAKFTQCMWKANRYEC